MEDEKEREVEQKIHKKKPLLNGQFVFKSDDTVVCVHCNDEVKIRPQYVIIIVSSAYKACICVGNQRRPLIYIPAKFV